MREITINSTTWISVARPNEEEIAELKKRFPDVHPLIFEELLTSTIRPRVENYGSHLFLVLHFPSFLRDHSKTISREIDFILTEDTLLTAHYDPIGELDDFWHDCQYGKIPKEHAKTPVHLLYDLLRQFYVVSLQELDQLQERIEAMEKHIFSSRENSLLKEIALLKQNVLDFRRAVKPQHLTLESLVEQGTELYGPKVRPFLTDLVGEYLKVWNLLENHKDTLDALYETNTSLLVAKTNQIMVIFTVIAAMTFIPSAVETVGRMSEFEIALTTAFIAPLLIYIWLKWRGVI